VKRGAIRYDPHNDFYKLLGVPSNANLEQVQQAFRRKAKEVHPDRNPDRIAWATEQFRRLSEAYEVLSDAARRWEYDRQRRQANAAAYTADSAAWTRQARPESARPPDPREGEAFWTWYRSVKPRYTRHNDPYAAAVRNLVFSPYRYVLLILGVVFFTNVVFISLAQQNGLMQRALQQEQTAVALTLAPTQTYAAALQMRVALIRTCASACRALTRALILPRSAFAARLSILSSTIMSCTRSHAPRRPVSLRCFWRMCGDLCATVCW
jgi:hypothetical protein